MHAYTKSRYCIQNYYACAWSLEKSLSKGNINKHAHRHPLLSVAELQSPELPPVHRQHMCPGEYWNCEQKVSLGFENDYRTALFYNVTYLDDRAECVLEGRPC